MEMTPEISLLLSEFTTRGVASWLFLIFVGVKVLSTVIGLIQTKREGLQPIVWWISKLSALAVAISAFALAYFAGDRVAQLVFGTLFLFASIVILSLALRRNAVIKQTN